MLASSITPRTLIALLVIYDSPGVPWYALIAEDSYVFVTAVVIRVNN